MNHDWLRLKVRETGILGLVPALARSARSRVWRRRGLAVYMWPHGRPAPAMDEPVCERGRPDHLRAHQRSTLADPSPQELMESVSSRLRKGAVPYTRVEQGVLAHYGWVLERQYFAADEALGFGYRLPHGSASLFDFRTHPRARGKGLYRRTLSQIVNELLSRRDVEHMHISAYSDNLVSRHVIETLGFELVAEITSTFSFGRVSWTADWRGEEWPVLPLDHPDAVDQPLSRG